MDARAFTELRIKSSFFKHSFQFVFPRYSQRVSCVPVALKTSTWLGRWCTAARVPQTRQWALPRGGRARTEWATRPALTWCWLPAGSTSILPPASRTAAWTWPGRWPVFFHPRGGASGYRQHSGFYSLLIASINTPVSCLCCKGQLFIACIENKLHCVMNIHQLPHNPFPRTLPHRHFCWLSVGCVRLLWEEIWWQPGNSSSGSFQHS